MFFGNTWIITKISAFCNISSIPVLKITVRYFLITHTNVPPTLRHESSENSKKIAILQEFARIHIENRAKMTTSLFFEVGKRNIPQKKAEKF